MDNRVLMKYLPITLWIHVTWKQVVAVKEETLVAVMQASLLVELTCWRF